MLFLLIPFPTLNKMLSHVLCHNEQCTISLGEMKYTFFHKKIKSVYCHPTDPEKLLPLKKNYWSSLRRIFFSFSQIQLFNFFPISFQKCLIICWELRRWTEIWAPPSEFVSSSIPSWQTLTVHAHPFRGARDLAFCLKVPLNSLLVWVSSEGSGETARMRRLARTFAARIDYKYQIRLTRSILCPSLH